MRQCLNKYIGVALLCILLAAIPTGYTYAQDDTADEEYTVPAEKRDLTAAEWNEITNDQDYNYRDSLEYKKNTREVKPPADSGFKKALMAFFAWLGSTWGQIIVWGLLILIVLYAIYRVVSGDTSGIFGRKSKTTENPSVQPDTEDITETNWDQLLQKAAKEGDLRLSVRYSYMLLLQILQHNELIQYRSDKTNYDYYSELADTPYKQTFRQLSRQYEYTWYGNFAISQETYEEYMRTLNDLKKQLGR
jgi:hypothetical protein